jgi:hypothetical protein
MVSLEFGFIAMTVAAFSLAVSLVVTVAMNAETK